VSASPIIEWLLEGDPAIRWQTMRDLAGASKADVEQERQKVAREGWGQRLLAKQNPSGRWAGGPSPDAGLYTPKWTSTTYTLLLLRDFGLPAENQQARKGCAILLDRALGRGGETCVTGMLLSLLSYFRIEEERRETVVNHLLEEQMPDGGWNCRRRRGATHSSMHTTITALEALRHYELCAGPRAGEVRAAQRRGREFLLVHRLFRSHRTGAVIKPEFLRLAYPPRWHYDILRALDYFQSVNAPRDPRLSEAIEIVRGRQDEDGRWPLEYSYKGPTYFELERLRKPSRWNTLRALRVLRWWEGKRRAER